MELVNGIFALINLGVSLYVLKYSFKAFCRANKKNKSVGMFILGIGGFFSSYAIASVLLYFLTFFSVLDTNIFVNYIRFMSSLTMIVLGMGLIAIFKEQV